MTIENIMLLLDAYEGWDYFIQMVLFLAAVATIGLVAGIIISILGTIRTLAEGVACLLSWGRVTPYEEKGEGFKFPALSSLWLGKKTEEKTEKTS